MDDNDYKEYKTKFEKNQNWLFPSNIHAEESKNQVELYLSQGVEVECGAVSVDKVWANPLWGSGAN